MHRNQAMMLSQPAKPRRCFRGDAFVGEKNRSSRANPYLWCWVPGLCWELCPCCLTALQAPNAGGTPSPEQLPPARLLRFPHQLRLLCAWPQGRCHRSDGPPQPACRRPLFWFMTTTFCLRDMNWIRYCHKWQTENPNCLLQSHQSSRH